MNEHVSVPVQDDYAAYESLAQDVGDHRWAFGTGFTDPLAGIDTTVPPGVDQAALGEYCLMLGDDALIHSHRLQEWVTRAPELEEETALANIALDLLGQARMLLARAGTADGTGRTEDDLAFLRDAGAFRHVGLAQHVDADFAEVVVRLLVLSAWRLALFDRLHTCADPVLRAIAGKAVKELAYHRDYAAAWVIRLGDGTPLSHEKTQAALQAIWPEVGELFAAHPVEVSNPAIAVDPGALRPEVLDVLAEVLRTATLTVPTRPTPGTLRGRTGVHDSSLRDLLTELQSVARALPGASW